MSAVAVRLSGMLRVKDKMTLNFEAAHAVSGNARANATKEVLIRELFDESATLYYQRLGRLIDDPEALVYAPMLVRRLRRMREKRQAARSARRRITV